MRKIYLTHFVFLASFFIFISLLKGWFSLVYVPFWIGGLIGVVLPDVDHFIYIYLMRPQELTSQRATRLMASGNIGRTMSLLAETRGERKHLVFHTATFQMIFIVFAFLIISSSNSLLGRGLVLGFGIHLLIDQLVDIVETESLDNWFDQIKITVNKERALVYWFVNMFIILLFGFLF